jgi:hypothetical protein
MEIITSNPIVYKNKVQLDTNLGEDLSGYIENLNFMEGRISDFDGNADEDLYYTCDNKTYHKFDGADLYVGFDGEYYNAKGEGVKGFFKKIGQGFKFVGKGIGQGVKSVATLIKANKGARQLRRSNRQSRRKDRRGDREANRQDRHYTKMMSKAQKRADGKYVKKDDKGQDVVIPKENITTGADGNLYDKKDIDPNKTFVDTDAQGNKSLVTEYFEDEVAIGKDERGNEVIYAKEDVASSTPETEKGMSKTMKFSLIVGGSVLFIGAVAFLIYKSRKNK